MTPSILYHYCSNQAFQSIVQSKALRLSLLSLSNDAKEGHHAVDIATRLLPEDFRYKDDLIRQLTLVSGMTSAIGFCLSADGDLLSQWRGYADDAKGVAIGFASDILTKEAEHASSEERNVRLVPIAYNESLATKLIEPELKPIIELYSTETLIRPGGLLHYALPEADQARDNKRYFDAYSQLFPMLLQILNYAYMIKSPFFEEEREWRIISRLTAIKGVLQLSDPKFDATSDAIRPFSELPLGKGDAPAIKEVCLGPRNQTPTEVIRLLLNQSGFPEAKINRSIGSYR